MSDFKVGDTVKINGGVKLGMIGTITYEFVDNYYLVQLEDGKEIIKSGKWLELVNDQEIKEDKEMKKSDLINGRTIVQLKNGINYLLINDRFVRQIGFIDISNYKDDLTHGNGCFISENLDVVKVAFYEPECYALEAYITRYIEWDWERKEEDEIKKQINELKRQIENIERLIK